MNNELANSGKVLIYQNEKGDTKIDVYFEDDTIWMTQRSMAALYQVDVRTVNEHIGNIVDDGELREEATIRNFRIVRRGALSGLERHKALQPELETWIDKTWKRLSSTSG